MALSSRRFCDNYKKLDKNKNYTLDDAIELFKNSKLAKFNETVEVSVSLGIDPKKSDQMVRSSVILPHGTGKVVRVAVFAKNDDLNKAIEAGADVSGDDLVEQLKKGEINFDVAVATPESMKDVAKFAKLLGPRGLMPNPKIGTVSPDIGNAVKDMKSGRVGYRADKYGIVHVGIGKISFELGKIVDNFNALIGSIKKAKPVNSKGVYINKISMSTTMGFGLKIDLGMVGK